MWKPPASSPQDEQRLSNCITSFSWSALYGMTDNGHRNMKWLNYAALNTTRRCNEFRNEMAIVVHMGKGNLLPTSSIALIGIH
eukprot:scaffold232683_cov17-Prasinocladus_malaysianus.AAC.1